MPDESSQGNFRNRQSNLPRLKAGQGLAGDSGRGQADHRGHEDTGAAGGGVCRGLPRARRSTRPYPVWYCPSTSPPPLTLQLWQ